MSGQPVDVGMDDTDRPIELVMITLPGQLKDTYRGCIGGFHFERGVCVSRMVSPSDKAALRQFAHAWPGAEITTEIPPTVPITRRQVNRGGRFMTAPRMVREEQGDVLKRLEAQEAKGSRPRAVRAEVTSNVVESVVLIESPPAVDVEKVQNHVLGAGPKGPKAVK